MTQIVSTTNELLVDSYQLIGELADNEIPSGLMLSRGLNLINEILAKFTSDSIYVPYLTTLNSTFKVGQGTYSVSDMISDTDIISDRIIDLSFANYTVQSTGTESIVYPLFIISKAEYYNVTRLDKLQTRPSFIFLDKQAVESFLIVYPVPDQPYPFSVQVKVMLDSVTANQDLSELPPYYYGFLKYAVGRKLKAYYPSANWPEENEKEYEEYITNLKNANETDLTIRPSAICRVEQPFYWWQNILAY